MVQATPFWIYTHPAPTTRVKQGSIEGSLKVEAVASPGATIKYQWYSNRTYSNTSGTAIQGETKPEFQIPTTLTTSGSPYYYYCYVRAEHARWYSYMNSMVAVVYVSR
jgi:hypothetical protein